MKRRSCVGTADNSTDLAEQRSGAMRVGPTLIPGGEYGVLDIRAKYAIRTWTDARGRIIYLQISNPARMLVTVALRNLTHRWFLVTPLYQRLLRA